MKTKAYQQEKHRARAQHRADKHRAKPKQKTVHEPMQFASFIPTRPTVFVKSNELLLFRLEQRDAERRLADENYRGIPSRGERQAVYRAKHAPQALAA